MTGDRPTDSGFNIRKFSQFTADSRSHTSSGCSINLPPPVDDTFDLNIDEQRGINCI